MSKAAKTVLGENLRALKAAAPIGVQNGNKFVAEAAKVGEGTVARARSGDGNTTVATLDAIAGYYKREAWELLCRRFDPGQKLYAYTDGEIDEEVMRRLQQIIQQKTIAEVSDEKARSGPSRAYPFGALQDARPEPPPPKARAEAKGAGTKGPANKK